MRGPKAVDITGNRYGSLIAVESRGRSPKAMWLCKCDCGSEVVVRSNGLRTGNTTSCGCSRKVPVQEMTQAYLRTILDYNGQTGRFTWLKPPKYDRDLLGQEAGCRSSGYVIIRIGNKKYQAHRLAWLYVHGSFPPTEETDHWDRDKCNNALDNLRPATRGQNQSNTIGRSKKGYPKGVRETSAGRFQARITHENVAICIGQYGTANAANEAYFAEARRLKGEFARAG